MLRYTDENGREVDKVQQAIRYLKSFEPPDGYFLAFSGGKDSQCVYHLAQMAGVKFDAHYSVTSVDPPELVRFIKTQYPEVSFDIPHDEDGNPVTMWSLIAKKTMLPTRLARYCCSELKEAAGKGRITVTGVRWAESARRRNIHGVVGVRTRSQKLIDQATSENPAAKYNGKRGIIMNDDNDESRRFVEQCYRTRKTLINPIVDWEDEDVWEFLNEVVKVPHCCLYDEGFKRLGCIGCPLAGCKSMLKEFERWPKYKELYLRAIERMIANHSDDIKLLKRLDSDHESVANLKIAFERERERAGDLPVQVLADSRRLQAEFIMDWWLGWHSKH